MKLEKGDKIRILRKPWINHVLTVGIVTSKGVYCEECRSICWPRGSFEKISEKFKFGDEVCAIKPQYGKTGKLYYIGKCKNPPYDYLCSICDPNKLGPDGFRDFNVVGYNKIEHWIDSPKEYSMQEIADALRINVNDLRIKR